MSAEYLDSAWCSVRNAVRTLNGSFRACGDSGLLVTASRWVAVRAAPVVCVVLADDGVAAVEEARIAPRIDRAADWEAEADFVWTSVMAKLSCNAWARTLASAAMLVTARL